MPVFPRTARWARHYRALGLNPLPSCADRKRPALKRYAAYRDGEPIPEKWLEKWWAPNIQLPTGTAWNLAVIDLDGPAAMIRWNGLVRQFQEWPPACTTWTVRSGGEPGGLHLYFRLPEGLDACPTRRLWGVWDDISGDWLPHCFIELKADRGLIVAPPSRHVRTGNEYRFVTGLTPRDLGLPAPIPPWVLALPGVARPITAPSPIPPPRPSARGRRLCGRRRGRYHAWRDVLDALSDHEKVALVRGWGLRLAADHANAAGWVRCHAIGRADRDPSASFCPASGYYSEPGVRRMNLFDIAVALGIHATWLDCLDELGTRMGI